MDPYPWIAALAAASATALLAQTVLAFLLAPLISAHPRPAPPWLVRPVWPVAKRIAAALRARLPSPYLSRTLDRLRAADLDRAVAPSEWIAAQAIYGALGAAAGAAIAHALSLSPGLPVAVGASVGAIVPTLRLRALATERARGIRRELPTFLDVITLAVESGSSLTAAIAMAVEKADDGPMRRALLRFLADVRAGRPRADALRALDVHLGLRETQAFVGALLQSEQTGARLGDVLRHQATQRAQERFARAEKQAMQAPVKMLGPLVLCIFPCTFLVLGFPIAVKLMEGF
jgi:tight adherence protein C